jgi:hypothetical protein
VSRAGLALGALLFSACTNSTPNLPGTFLGSFQFTGQMVVGGDGGGSTTCQVDGGALTYPSTVQFYAQLSLLDAGAMVWQLQNATPVEGAVMGNGFSVVTRTLALVSGCNCTADLTETVALSAAGGLVSGIGSLTGTIDDRLVPDLDAGPYCGSADAGLEDAGECLLGCDLWYAVSGTPGTP